MLDETTVLKTKTRLAKEGDVLGGDTPEETQAKTVNQKVHKKIHKEAAALSNIVAPDDKKDIKLISRIDPLLVGRSNVIYEKGESFMMGEHGFGRNGG